MKLLFVCTANIERSVTAEKIFADAHETRSRGCSSSARNILHETDLVWADVVFVVEGWHVEYIKEKFPEYSNKVYNLNIPDHYGYMSEKLIEELKRKVGIYFENL